MFQMNSTVTGAVINADVIHRRKFGLSCVLMLTMSSRCVVPISTLKSSAFALPTSKRKYFNLLKMCCILLLIRILSVVTKPGSKYC